MLGLQPSTTVARVAAQYAYMVSSDFESPEARYALGPYTPVDPHTQGTYMYTCTCNTCSTCTCISVHVHV